MQRALQQLYEHFSLSVRQIGRNGSFMLINDAVGQNSDRC